MNKQHLLPIVAAGLALLSPAAIAQDGRIDVSSGGDTAWMLACCSMGLLTLPGLALFYAGRVRSRNALSPIIQCAAIFALCSLLWFMVGYTLGFGEVGKGWIGNGNAWMLVSLGNLRDGTSVPESVFALFQMIFACLAPAFLAGAWAERARFGWTLAFAGAWSIVVYAPVAHWISGSGWLARGVGTLDWSGGIAVHVTAGVSALALAIMLGRRRGVAPGQVAPHGSLITVAGASLLWIGWLSLAGGSALTANDDAGAAIISMHVACAASALTWMLLERIARGKPSATGFAIGINAGIAAVSPAAGYISPGGAAVFGLAGAIACWCAMQFMRRRLKIDDALGVFAVHGVGGVLGALLLAPFLSPLLGGVGYGEGMNPIAQLVAQGVGVAVVAAWSLIASVIIALMASLAFPMRVSESAERTGLDASSHGEQAWHFD
ncbi:ammonium transporter [Novosphingobium sp. FGD1]|jgi:ammonium transporter, Amt family|uniref:Ammonium transporter n=1 Tax=Novosphingobium silvae TaxID=2692619 RepID=A0A7X4GG28_9SPHN|nr:ammonium transporter [Novosphingobium silvae]MYL97995.1 ammonium transporter [Novosphingobium silvae]